METAEQDTVHKESQIIQQARLAAYTRPSQYGLHVRSAKRRFLALSTTQAELGPPLLDMSMDIRGF